jgi:hypothetical protein
MNRRFYGCHPVIHYLVLYTLLSVAMLVVGCQPSELATDNSPLNTPSALSPSSPTMLSTPDAQVQFRWLQKIPCAAPCWEGVTPGVTSGNEAYTLLRNNPQISNVEMRISQLMPEVGYVVWKWSGTDFGGDITFAATSISHEVSIIHVYTAESFSLDEVMAAFGSPSHIMVSAGRGPDIGSPVTYDLSIVYLDRGFMVPYIGDDITLKPLLSADLPFYSVDFFQPSLEGMTGTSGLAPADVEQMLLPWQGIKDFDYYCKQRYGNDSDVCQDAEQ